MNRQTGDRPFTLFDEFTEKCALSPPLSFAVLPNPVPDRQPCSALCRMASLGPLPQAEIMTGFPEEVSDWTVIYFYPQAHMRVGVQRKTC